MNRIFSSFRYLSIPAVALCLGSAEAKQASVAAPLTPGSSAKAEVGPSGKMLSNPCPGVAQPVLLPNSYLITNRSSTRLLCRMKNPDFGGWSDFLVVPAGGKLIDRQVEADEIHVQCQAPARTRPVRIFPRERYALLRQPGGDEITVNRIVAGQ